MDADAGRSPALQLPCVAFIAVLCAGQFGPLRASKILLKALSAALACRSSARIRRNGVRVGWVVRDEVAISANPEVSRHQSIIHRSIVFPGAHAGDGAKQGVHYHANPPLAVPPLS